VGRRELVVRIVCRECKRGLVRSVDLAAVGDFEAPVTTETLRCNKCSKHLGTVAFARRMLCVPCQVCSHSVVEPLPAPIVTSTHLNVVREERILISASQDASVAVRVTDLKRVCSNLRDLERHGVDVQPSRDGLLGIAAGAGIAAVQGLTTVGMASWSTVLFGSVAACCLATALLVGHLETDRRTRRRVASSALVAEIETWATANEASAFPTQAAPTPRRTAAG
jgi:hypothetical protein